MVIRDTIDDAYLDGAIAVIRMRPITSLQVSATLSVLERKLQRSILEGSIDDLQRGRRVLRLMVAVRQAQEELEAL